MFFRFVRAFCLVLPVLFFDALTTSFASAAVLDGLAAMGDSLTAGGAVTGSWVPPLVNERGLDFGGGGNPYNVAVGGATSASLLTQGQHTDVAALVQAGDVTTAALLIGGNDFGGITAVSIANGLLAGAALQNFIDGVATNIITAASTVLAEDPEGFLLIGTPDVTFSPSFQSINPTAVQTQRLADAIDGVNTQLVAYAQTQDVVFIDSSAWMRDNLIPGSLVVGGVNITVTGSSSDPHFFFQDGLHPAAVGNGLIASLGIAALDHIYSAGVGTFSDFEVLELAGIENEFTSETYSSSVDLTSYAALHAPAAGRRQLRRRRRRS